MLSLKNITQSKLIRNSAKLLSANAIAQAIGLLVYPILSRLYTPEDFGLLNLFLGLGGLLVLLSTAEYQYAILLPREERKSKGAFQVCMVLLLSTTLLLVLTMPFRESIALCFKAEQLVDYYFLLPIFVLLGGLWNVLNMYYTRKKLFNAVSAYQLSQSILSSGTKIALFYTPLQMGGLLYATVIASLGACIATISRHLKGQLKELLSFDKLAFKTALIEYRKFPFFSLPRAFANNLSNTLPTLLLTPFFGLSLVGYFSMAVTLAFRPIAMICNSIHQVLFQRVVEQVNLQQSIIGLFKRYSLYTILLIIPIFVVLYILMPTLVIWLLGEGWEMTATCIRWMLPWLCITCLSSPICFVSDVFMQQKVGFVFEMLIVLMRLLGIMTGILTNSFMNAVMGYCLMSAVILFIQWLWFIWLVLRYEKKRIG